MSTPVPAAPIGGCGAVLLAGGRATRMDGADKPLQIVAGATLLEHALAAARALDAAPIIVAGPQPARPPAGATGVQWVRERPAYAGPAAAVVTALAHMPDPGPEWMLLLACDLPQATAAARLLAETVELLPTENDGVCLADRGSRPQWLTGLYRTRSLRRTATALPDAGRDMPVRALMDELAVAVIGDRGGLSDDVDTWDDLRRARQQPR